MAHRLLSEWGFRVFEAESGEEAMEVLETARSGCSWSSWTWSCRWLDGVQVTRRIQERWPGQRTLYMSAHPAEVLAQYGLTELDAPFPGQALHSRRAAHQGERALGRASLTRPREPPR